jgi:hypothetical protein
MSKRILKTVKPAAVVLAIGFIYIILHYTTGFSISCPLHSFTGFNCPGCGLSRMILNILKLNFSDAFRCNPVIFCLLPVFGVFLALHLYKYIRYGDSSFKKWENVVFCSIAAVLVIFGVVRNVFPDVFLIP